MIKKKFALLSEVRNVFKGIISTNSVYKANKNNVMKEAYKWVDLQKEPNNIPEYDENVLVYYTLPTSEKSKEVYEYKVIARIASMTEGKGYKRYDWQGDEHQSIEPTHWCYLPPSLPKHIEDAIDAEVEKHSFQIPYNGTNDFYDEAKAKSFKTGAEYGYSLSLSPIISTIPACEALINDYLASNITLQDLCTGLIREARAYNEPNNIDY